MRIGITDSVARAERVATCCVLGSPSPLAGNAVELGRGEARLKHDEARVEGDGGRGP